MGPRWVVGHHWLNRGTHVVYPIENWPYSVCHFGITRIMYLFILWDNYMEVLLPIYPPVTDCGAHDMRNIPYQNHQPIGIQSQIYSSWFIQRFFMKIQFPNCYKEVFFTIMLREDVKPWQDHRHSVIDPHSYIPEMGISIILQFMYAKYSYSKWFHHYWVHVHNSGLIN